MSATTSNKTDGAPSRILQRTISKTLSQLALKGDINDTKSLVAALNSATDPFERKALMDWARHYVDWFVEQPIERIDAEDAQEYVLIGQVLLHGPFEKKLLRSWLCSLCNAIHKGPYGVTNIVSALDVALLSIDKGIFDGDSEPLLRLANDLLSSLDPGKSVFTEGTYSTHSATMSALHQTFVAIQETSPDLLDPSLRGGVYQTFKTHLQEIAKSQRFYRFKFLVKMIEQSIQRLELREKLMTLTLGCSRLFHGVTGVLCILDGIRGFAEIEFKLDAFEAGHRNLRRALTSQCIKRKPWYEWIQALNCAALLASQDPEKFAVFETCYDSLKQKQRRMKKSEDRWTIRCGIIGQLVSLTLHAPNDGVRLHTFEKLLDLGKKKKFGGWVEDKAILQPLLDAFCSVYNVVTRNQKEDLEEAVKMFEPFKKLALQEIFTAWRNGQSIRERLAAKNLSPTADVQGKVFHLVKEKIGLSDIHRDSQEHRDALKAIYQAPAFAKVASLFDNEKPRHVASFKYSLVRYEEATGSPGETKKEDRSLGNSDRKDMVPKPTLLKNLFEGRSRVSGGPVKAVQKVLLVGNPGTGKTSLAKKLAYHWAEGEWGIEHDAVYVVQVRELSESLYDGTHVRKEPTVANAVANNSFPWQEDAKYSALRQHINAELEKETTLLILDGLDEEAGASKRILEEAKHCPCKLLMLSRPYGLHEERELVDFEVECLGLSDDQLVDFIESELPEESSELVAFLKTNPSVWTVAHVPVIANIVCFLWKEKSGDLLVSDTNDSPFKLYTCMVQHIWKRHAEKHRVEDVDRKNIFAALGRIAFNALKQGQILISQTIVEEESQSRSFSRTLRTSGFLLLQLKGILYHFAHFTFQEFFAGTHMVKVLYHGNRKEVRDAENFIAQNKYNPRHRVMLSFMAEEIRSIDGVEGFNRLMSIINCKPRDIAGVQHFILSLTVLEAFSSVTFDQAELDDLFNSEALQVAKMATSLWNISPSGSNLERLMLKALEDAPKTMNNFGHLADTLLDRSLGLLSDEALRKKTSSRYKRIIKQARNHRSKIVINRGAVSDVTDDKVYTRSSKHTMRKTSDDPVRTRVMKRVTTGSQDTWGNVRKAAIEKNIPTVHESRPQLAIHAADALLEECDSRWPDVRKAAIEKLPAALESQPQLATKVADVLIKGCGDESVRVRKAAIEKLPAALESQPQLASKVADALIKACEDKLVDVQIAAIRKLPAGLESRPQLASKVADALIKACGDERVDVQIAAIRKLPAGLESKPQLASKVADAVIKACEDASADVRKAAVEKLPAVLESLPQLASKVADVLIKACGDESADVQIAASQKIDDMIETRPQLASKVADVLIKACGDEPVDVQIAAIRKIPAVLESQPQLATKVADVLIKACEDGSADARMAAVENIPVALESQPQLATKVANVLIKACEDDSSKLRKLAFGKISDMVASQPQDACSLVHCLIAGCKDKSADIREFAIRKVFDLVASFIGLRDVLADTLIEGCRDDASTVRQFATEQIPALIRILPERVDDLLEALIKTCEDQTPFLCDLAHRTIGPLLYSVAAHKTTDVIRKFLSLSSSNRGHIGSFSKWSLGQLSIQLMIDCYFHCFDPKLICYIAPAFLNLAACALSSAAEHLPVKLVLHISSLTVAEWKRPANEIEDFLKALKAEINDKHPMLLQITGAETDLKHNI